MGCQEQKERAEDHAWQGMQKQHTCGQRRVCNHTGGHGSKGILTLEGKYCIGVVKGITREHACVSEKLEVAVQAGVFDQLQVV